MKRFIAHLLPRRIAAQTAAVVVLSVVLVHVAITVQFLLLDDHPGDRRDFVHVGTIVRLVAAAAPGEDRHDTVEDAARAFPSIQVSLSSKPPPGLPTPLPPPDRHGPPGSPFGDLGPQVRVFEAVNGGEWRDRPPPDGDRSIGRHFAVAFPSGEWLHVVDRPYPRPPLFLGPTGVSIVFIVLSSLLLGFWGVRGLVGPLRALAAAARDFDIAGEAAPLPKRGPEEVRVAAAAFEAMRLRIRSLVDDRTRMLAAMGHDLRTPLTRLRLRSEFVGDDGLKAEIQRDLSAMTEMIEGALVYLAQGRDGEKPALVDVSATLQTIADGWSDLGRDVTYDGPAHLALRVRPLALERAVNNLVDNALRYGTKCILRARSVADGGATIEVEDDGPGIAESEREAMLKPFVRGDAARNMDEQRGFGLGLAIVAAVVAAHRGTLHFDDAVPHGLRARIELPGAPKPA